MNDISTTTIGNQALSSGMPDAGNLPAEQDEAAFEFERIFARQLVEQMTKGLFKSNDNGVMNSGSDLYRDHIIETLSNELAKQESLGFSEMIRDYRKQFETTNEPTP